MPAGFRTFSAPPRGPLVDGVVKSSLVLPRVICPPSSSSHLSAGQTSVTPVYMNNPFPSVQFIDRLNVLYNLDYYGDAQNSIGNVDFASSGYTFNPGNLGHAYSSSPASIWQTGNYPVMDPSTVSFSTNSSGTTILTGYAAVVGSCSRRPNMALLCDSTLPSPVLTFLGEYTICVYSFTFSFNCSQASTAPYFRSILASSGVSRLIMYIQRTDVYEQSTRSPLATCIYLDSGVSIQISSQSWWPGVSLRTSDPI